MMTGSKAALGIVGAVLAAAAAPAGAADWPQYLGPNRDGISEETGLARAWPEGGPKVLWTVALGPGYGGAAVRAGKVYVLDRAGGKEDVLRCLDLETGRELWTFAYAAPGKLAHDGSRTVPAVDDRHVYIAGPFGQFHAVDLRTHRPAWQANLIKDFGGARPQWGIAQNPLLHGDLVIVSPLAKEAGVVAFERATGRVAWKSPFLPGSLSGTWYGSYVSPAVLSVGGADQVVMITAQGTNKAGEEFKGQVTGVSAADGAILWTYTGWQCDLPIAAPAILPGGRVFLTGAYDAGSAMIRIERQGRTFAATELYKTQGCGSQIHRPIFYKDHLFVVSNGKERREGLMCLSPGGEVRWHTTNSRFSSKAAEGLPNFDVGNLLIADGMIYILDGQTGDLRLLEASPEGYKELACAPGILGGREIWAPMALSDGRLLIRDQSRMKCLQVRAP
jgi:outer membrane protein assembly factor BamB